MKLILFDPLSSPLIEMLLILNSVYDIILITLILNELLSRVQMNKTKEQCL